MSRVRAIDQQFLRKFLFTKFFSCSCALLPGFAVYAQSATLPFVEDFEGASPLAQPHWTVTGTNDFRTQVTPANGPHGGSFHVTMDDSVDGGSSSRNELTLTVDLAGKSNVVLTFWAIDFGEKQHGPPPFGFVGGADFDGVAVSDDGTTWYEITDLRSPGNLSTTYSEITVCLDQEIFLQSIPVSFNSQFRIRFNQFDKNSIPNDGIGIDDITIQEVVPAATVDTLATNDSTPPLTGTITCNPATILVFVGGQVRSATTNGDGTWALADNALSPLADGVYDVFILATDVFGNDFTDATTDELTIDTIVPIVTVDLLTTNDTTPQLTGTVDDPTATVKVIVGAQVKTATNNGDGTWTLADNVLSPLADGVYDVVISATDAANNIGTCPDVDELVIDTVAPIVTVDALSTNDVTPALTGTVDEDNATLQVTVDGQVNAATNNGDGTWTLADNMLTALADGTFDVAVTATDPATNAGVDATTDELIIDATAPVVGVDALTTLDTTPQLTGTVDDVAAAIQVTVDGQMNAATNNGNGTWTLGDNRLTTLADGTYDVQVSATDAFSNVGADGTTNELTVDTTAPIVTVDPLTTNDTTPALTGTVDDPAAAIQVTVDGQVNAAANNGNGTWTLADDVLTTLEDGIYDVIVVATDVLSNAGTDATSNELVIDTAGPTVTIGVTSPPSSANGPVAFTITYTDAAAVTLDVADITIQNSACIVSGTVTVTGSGFLTRTVTIDNITGEGPMGISIAPGTAADSLGNLAGPAGPGRTSWVFQNNIAWVDFNAGSGGDGSQSSPFNTMQAALTAVTPCGLIRIQASDSSEAPLVISTALRIESVGGTSRIGVPSARSSSFPSLESDETLIEVDDTDTMSDSDVDGSGGDSGGSVESSDSEETDSQWAVILDRSTFEPVVPFTDQDGGVIAVRADGLLAIRLRGTSELAPDELWGDLDGYTEDEVSVTWKSARADDLTDVWVVFRPEGAWYVGDLLRTSAGAGPIGARAGEEHTYLFQVMADAQSLDVDLVPQPDAGGEPSASVSVSAIAPLPLVERIEPAFTIGPERVYESPRRVWLPLPPNVDPASVQLFYLHPYGEDKGWYPAENVEGWLLPDSYLTVEAYGSAYLGFLVHHAGIVQMRIAEE